MQSALINAQPCIWATNAGPHDAQQTTCERIADNHQNLAEPVHRAGGGHDDRSRCAVVHELHAGSFIQYLGIFLSGLARLPDRGCSAHGNRRMVIATSASSGSCAGVDLSRLDRVTYIRTMAHLLWQVRTMNYGT